VLPVMSHRAILRTPSSQTSADARTVLDPNELCSEIAFDGSSGRSLATYRKDGLPSDIFEQEGPRCIERYGRQSEPNYAGKG
jgi:hypothetical protein